MARQVKVVRVNRVIHRRPTPNKGPTANPRKPLSLVNRETFAQLVAKGVKLDQAYRQSGYTGSAVSRRQLRAAVDVDARIMYLLERQIEDDAKARHKREAPIQDRKSRILAELEHTAFSDIRDVIQWTPEPILNEVGEVTGYRPKATLTPSHLLTRAQAASIKRVFFKGGELNVEWQDKGSALEKLAKIEGLYSDGPTSISDNRTQTIVNVGSDRAMDAIKRLAFALQKAQEHQQLNQPLTITYAEPEHSKE